MRGGLAAGALAATCLLGAGCSAFPGAADAGRRALHDTYVTFTAPVQVPCMAAVEAWAACSGEEGSPKVLVPVYFVGYALLEAGLCAMHTIDLTAAPIHLVVGNGPSPIYDTKPFPMERRTAAWSGDTGELGLYDVGGVAGAVVAYWFGTQYFPHIFHWVLGD
jgi:hypothetical protein